MMAALKQFEAWCGVLLAGATLIGCSDRSVSLPAPPNRGALSEAGTRATAARSPRSQSSQLTPAMRVALLKAQQAEADTTYAFSSAKTGRGANRDTLYVAANPARSLSVAFTARSAVASLLVPEAASHAVTINLKGWGRGSDSSLHVVSPANPRLQSSPALDEHRQAAAAVNNRLEYSRSAGLSEWYLNGPAGLEQGFTLAARPAGEGSLTFDVAIAAEGTELVALADKIELRSSPEVVIGEYRDVFAEDADGKLLPTQLSVHDGLARISVDDRAARYPLTVDPLLCLLEAKLRAQLPRESGAAAAVDDALGSAVAVDGDTLLVGSPFDDDGGADAGAAYIFTRNGLSWQAGQKLLAQLPSRASDVAAGDHFGAAIALSGDTLAVGAPFNDAQGSDAGAVYLYERKNGYWSPKQRLTATSVEQAADAAAGDHFGSALALSLNNLIVGSSGDDDQGTDSGSAYLFTLLNQTWTSAAKLTAQGPGATPDGAAGDHFGAAVDIDRDTALVGSAADDDQGADSGSVYVFARSGLSWPLQQKLTAQLPGDIADGTAGDRFGTAVGVSAQTVVVGASGDNVQGAGSGSSYVFTWTGSVWSPQQKLEAQLPDGTPSGASGDGFGGAVAIRGDTIVVGSRSDDAQATDGGAAYVFERTAASWSVKQQLVARLAAGTADGSANDGFGAAVAISHDTLVVGSPGDDNDGADSGSTYVLTRDDGAWTTQARLSFTSTVGDSDGALEEVFGYSLAVEGDTALIGAPNESGQLVDTGAAYVFVRSAGRWSVQQKLLAELPGAQPDAKLGAHYGISVALSGDTAVVAAGLDNTSTDQSGAVYVYTRTGSTWTVQQRLKAELPGGVDNRLEAQSFGNTVAVDGDTVVVGAYGDSQMGWGAGAVFVFTRTASVWSSQQKLVDAAGVGGDGFGTSVGISGDTLAVGSPGDDEPGDQSGSTFVYTRAGSVWSLQQKITAKKPNGVKDGFAYDAFGTSLALDGDTLAVSSPGDDANAGSVFVMTRSGVTWKTQQKLTPQLPDGTQDGSMKAAFGQALAIEADTLVAGACAYASDSGNGGYAYVYTRLAGSWSPQHKLSGVLRGFFNSNSGVALSGDTILLGNAGDADQGSFSGSVYVFRRFQPLAAGSGCAEDAACASGACVDGVCCTAACDGVCFSCAGVLTGAADGTCAPLPAGTHCSDDPLKCGSPTSYRLASTCDGGGVCLANAAPCAGGYACRQGRVYGGCLNRCESHDDCDAEHHCDKSAHTCEVGAPDLGGGGASGAGGGSNDGQGGAGGVADADASGAAAPEVSGGAAPEMSGGAPPDASGGVPTSAAAGASSTAGGEPSLSAGGNAAGTAPGGTPPDDSGCGCRAPGHAPGDYQPVGWLGVALAFALGRRRPTRRSARIA